MSSAIKDWDRIVHKNVRSKDMEGIGNIAAIQEDSVIITTEGAQRKYLIPKSHVEGYNGAEVFLDLSANDVFTFNNKRSKENEEEILRANPRRNLDSNSSSINQEKEEKKESLRTVDMTMPKGWKTPAEDKARREAEDKARREAEDKARREAEAIVHTTKESKEEEGQQQIMRQENLVTSRENANYLRDDRDPFSANMTLWQYSTISWIDMYKEFAINAAKLSEYWFNLFWSPWTKGQTRDKVKVE